MNNHVTNLFPPDDVSGLGSIDAKAVIRAAKRRRLPVQLASGAVAVLAVVGIGISVQNLARPQVEMATLSQADESDPGISGRYDDASGFVAEDALVPANELNLCTRPLADAPPSRSGLVLSTEFPDGVGGDSPIAGTVTLTNTGETVVRGYTAASPVVTLSQDGTVIWHTNGVMIMSAAEIDLAPGETHVYSTSFTPVVCGLDDEGDAGFRADLPPAPAGEYQVSAAIDFMGDAGELVTGPLETITLK